MKNQYRVTLSNGRTLLIEEGDNCLHIATETTDVPNDVDAYLCQIDASGVLVMCNSGDACQFITEELPQFSLEQETREAFQRALDKDD